MGFTTKGEPTKRKTYHYRKDVIAFIEDFADEQGWNYSDVVNRAVLYYAYKAEKGELDDPMVTSSVEDVVENMKSQDDSRSISDLLGRD